MTKVLVIGGGGFLGRHVTAKLQTLGIEVRVCGRHEYPQLQAAGVETVRASVTDLPGLTAAMADVDAVFHMAAKVGVSGRYADYYAANVTGTENVIAACRAANVSRLIYTSTPSVVFGRDDIENGNETLPYPAVFLTHYAATKALAEQRVLAANSRELATCALRPHLIWGPGDTNLFPRIVSKARAGKLRQIGEGKNRVSVPYVGNAADAHAAALHCLKPGSAAAGRAYFINDPEPVNCWDFIRRILQTFNVPPHLRRISAGAAYALGAVLETAGRFRPGWEPPLTRFVVLQLTKNHWFSAAAASRDLGWTSAVTIEEGLQRTAAAFEL